MVSLVGPSSVGSIEKSSGSSEASIRAIASLRTTVRKFTLRLLQKLGRSQNVTLMCHCVEDQEQCHRHLLKELLARKNAVRLPSLARWRLLGFGGKAGRDEASGQKTHVHGPGDNGAAPHGASTALPKTVQPRAIVGRFAQAGAIIVTQGPFKTISLKNAPASSPSEIRTAQAAIKFIDSLPPETQAKMHWALAAAALRALARRGTYDDANRAMRNALAQEGWLAD